MLAAKKWEMLRAELKESVLRLRRKDPEMKQGEQVALKAAISVVLQRMRQLDANKSGKVKR